MQKLLLILLFIIPGTAIANDYFPCDQGYRREYRCAEDYTKWLVYHHIAEENGVSEVQLTYYENGAVTGHPFVWLLSVDGEGNLLFHGQSLPGTPIFEFVPVLPFLDAPLFVGKTWEGEGDLMNGEAVVLHLRAEFECLAFEQVETECGTFDCFHVVRDLYIDGPHTSEIHEWWADGVGLVKQYGMAGNGCTYILHDVLDEDGECIIGNGQTSWSSIKTLFR